MPNILARRGVLSFVFMPESSLSAEQLAARFLTAQKNIKFA
jgi:hypothetical protein